MSDIEIVRESLHAVKAPWDAAGVTAEEYIVDLTNRLAHAGKCFKGLVEYTGESGSVLEPFIELTSLLGYLTAQRSIHELEVLSQRIRVMRGE